MTATAFAFDPALDRYDDEQHGAARRPQLRLIEGSGSGHTPAAALIAPSVEVYRRRRFLALVVATIGIVVVSQLAGLPLLGWSVDTSMAVDDAPAVHVVLPGDTYSAIAANLGVADPVGVADQLRSANGGAELTVGQRLVVDLAQLGVASSSVG